MERKGEKERGRREKKKGKEKNRGMAANKFLFIITCERQISTCFIEEI